jgi:hypothetical protein
MSSIVKGTSVEQEIPHEEELAAMAVIGGDSGMCRTLLSSLSSLWQRDQSWSEVNGKNLFPQRDKADTNRPVLADELELDGFQRVDS